MEIYNICIVLVGIIITCFLVCGVMVQMDANLENKNSPPSTDNKENKEGMTTEEIIQGNKMIAEFMGYHFYEQDIWQQYDANTQYGVIAPVVSSEKLTLFKLKLGDFFGNKEVDCYKVKKHKDAMVETYDPFDLAYYKSWNTLMPVVEKIENMHYTGFPIVASIGSNGAYIGINESNAGGGKYQGKRVIANTLNCNYFHDDPNDADRLTKIQGVYSAVIQFIQWYNNTQKSKQ